jgi:hypothetical protein
MAKAKRFVLETLLPCPLCGKEPKIRPKPKYVIYCSDNHDVPHILGTSPLGYETEFEARSAWNQLVQKIKIIDVAHEDTTNNGDH